MKTAIFAIALLVAAGAHAEDFYSPSGEWLGSRESTGDGRSDYYGADGSWQGSREPNCGGDHDYYFADGEGSGSSEGRREKPTTTLDQFFVAWSASAST